MRTLHLASLHPRTPWYARVLAVLVVGYAFSPIDLIPDFIPILGYLDDVILLPLGIWLTLRLIPDEVWSEHAAAAHAEDSSGRRGSMVMAAAIVLLWIMAFPLTARVLWPLHRSP